MGQQMVSVTGLVADPHRHDHLMVSIDRHLAVVALNPAVWAFCRASALAASTSWARASPGMKHMY
jgi:glycogen synthase